jgi:hypothetical protein
MADQLDLEHSGLQEVANAMREESANMSNAAQKRKRDSESADDTRRLSNKRVSPNSGNDSGDQSLVNQQIAGVEALQDYTNLHQHQQGGPDHQNGSADHANASSTAAAALAGIYPTMTIPQPTDVSFATQGSDGDRGPDSSFMGDSQQPGDSFMDSSQQNHQGGGRSVVAPKPVVGSDEWHKVRKDNHKEGTGNNLEFFYCHTNLSQSNDVVERPSTRGSTNSRR